MTKPLTGEQVAALAGISTSAVSKLKNADDALHRQAGGYDVKEVGRWLHRRALASVGKPPGEALDLSHEQALLARERRKALEFEAEIRKGEYMLTAKVSESNRRAGMAIRDGVLSVPGRIAARCVGLDERKIDAIMTAALREELTRIADLAGTDA